jgi:hypothetical protein
MLRWPAEPERAVVERGGLRLGDRQQLGDIVGRHGGMRHQRMMQHREAGDRLEILHRIVAELTIEVRIDREGHVGAEQQRVTIRRRLGHVFGRDLRVAARLVLGDDLLIPHLAEIERQHARGRVGGAAGRGGHDDGDGFAREGLCVGSGRDRSQRCSRTNELQQLSHRFLPSILLPHFPKSVSAIQSAVNGRNL